MKKHVKTCVSLLLVLCLLSTTVFAANENNGDCIVQPRYNHISLVAVGLNMSLTGKATCTTSVTLYSAAHSAEITMVLYRSDDGITWDEVKRWVYTDDGPDIDVQKVWYVNPGFDYVVQSWVYVCDANGIVIETTACDSPIKSY